MLLSKFKSVAATVDSRIPPTLSELTWDAVYPRSRLRTSHAAPAPMCSRLNQNITCAILQAKSKTKRGSLLGFTFDDVDPEAATRYKFDPKKHDFVKDTVKMKMQNETMVTELPGATRVLFRCKVPPDPSLRAAGDGCADSHGRPQVLSKLRGADNYVAKAYREQVSEATREIYFIDCKMQIMAKTLAEEFNKLKPPHRFFFPSRYHRHRQYSGANESSPCITLVVAWRQDRPKQSTILMEPRVDENICSGVGSISSSASFSSSTGPTSRCLLPKSLSKGTMRSTAQTTALSKSRTIASHPMPLATLHTWSPTASASLSISRAWAISSQTPRHVCHPTLSLLTHHLLPPPPSPPSLLFFILGLIDPR